MSKRIEFSIVAVVILLVGGLMWLGTAQSPQPNPSQNAGSFSPTGGGTYNLASSVGPNDTTIRLQSFNEPVSGIPYTMNYLGSTIEYGTLAPQTNHSEFITFNGITPNSDGSVTLTGVIRGISRTPGTGGCVASSTLAQSHSAQEIFILSNSPCFYSNYVTNTSGNSNVILSSNTFASTTYQGFDLDPGASYFNSAASSTFVDQAQLNRLTLANCVNATSDTVGCVQLATARQAASSTVTGSSGANDVLWSKYATDTPGMATTSVIMSLMTGKLAQGWLDLTQTFNFSGLLTFGSGFIDNASSTFTSTANFAVSPVGVSTISKLTASTTITGATTPQPVYIATSTGAVSLSQAEATSSADKFDGFAISNATNGGTVNVQQSGVVNGFTSLTAGTDYYVSSTTPGSITSTLLSGGSELYVGTAISSTQIQILPRDMEYIGSQPLTVTLGQNQTAITTVILAYSRMAIIKVSGGAGSALGSMSGTVQLTPNAAISPNFAFSYLGGASSAEFSFTFTWNAATVASSTGSITTLYSCDDNGSGCSGGGSGSATAYFYR